MMREPINILKYGFLLFLLISGIVSIFNTETHFINSINSLSIPIFAFSISILLAKANQYARAEILKQIQNKSTTIDKIKKDIDKKEKVMIDIECNSEIEQFYKDSLISSYEYIFLCKYFNLTDFFTRLFNGIAILSFCWCLLSLIGVFKITGNFAWVNIFSLALVFFDFFILDDLMSKMFNKKINQFRKKAERETSKNEK